MIPTWVDFRAVKQAVSMEMAIACYGVMLRRIHDPYLRGRCPLPSHTSKSSTQSLIVNTEKNAWACHSDSCVASRGGRAGGNVLDFVAAMERCSVREAALKLQDWFAVVPASTGKKQVVYDAEGHDRFTPAIMESPIMPLGFVLSGIDPRHPYLGERGVDPQTAAHFGIGFYPGKGSMEGRIVIPIHNEDGALVAYAGRKLGESEPRYKFPARFRKSLVLFNLHRAACHGLTVIVVEGFFDCVKVHQAGLPCVVALMGSSLSQCQEALLQKHFRDVVLMLDGDKSGRYASEAITPRLVKKLSVRLVALPPDIQPDGLSADQIRCLCDPGSL
jgi:DNA primase